MRSIVLGAAAILLGATAAHALDFGCDRRFGRDAYGLCLQQEEEYNAKQQAAREQQRDRRVSDLQGQVDEQKLTILELQAEAREREAEKQGIVQHRGQY